MTENEISRIPVEAALGVHREIGGPGLVESVCEEAGVEEPMPRGCKVERPLRVPILCKGGHPATPLRSGLKVNGLPPGDNQAVAEWHPLFEARMPTQLRLTGLKSGRVIHWGSAGRRTAFIGSSTVFNSSPPLASLPPRVFALNRPR